MTGQLRKAGFKPPTPKEIAHIRTLGESDIMVATLKAVETEDTRRKLGLPEDSICTFAIALEIGMTIMHARQEQALQDAYDKGFHEGHKAGRVHG